MNRCQRLIRSLSEEEKMKVPLRNFNALERKLFSIYLRQDRDVSISEIAERLGLHSVHISRTNSELLFKIASIYPRTEIEAYLRLFVRARLFQTLKAEILTIQKKIHRLKSNDSRIHAYNTLFSIAGELQESAQSIQFLKKLYALCKQSHTVFPEGHLQAYELMILNAEIFLKKMCLVQQREVNEFLRDTSARLVEYESQIERVNNPLFKHFYLKALRAFHLFVKDDVVTFDSLCESGLDAAISLRDYAYQFPPFSRSGSETTFLAMLFFLHRDDDLIRYIETLPQTQKKILFFEYENLSLPNRYLEALISNDKLAIAVSFSKWYSDTLSDIRSFDAARTFVVLKMMAITKIISGMYSEALLYVTKLAHLNHGVQYNRGRDMDVRRLECALYILLDRQRDAQFTIERNIKWIGRHPHSAINKESLILLKFMESALEYHNSGGTRLLKKCLRIFNQYPHTDSNFLIMKLIAKKFSMRTATK